MINLSTLLDDMKQTLHWSDRAIYSRHYSLPEAKEVSDNTAHIEPEPEKPPGYIPGYGLK